MATPASYISLEIGPTPGRSIPREEPQAYLELFQNLGVEAESISSQGTYVVPQTYEPESSLKAQVHRAVQAANSEYVAIRFNIPGLASPGIYDSISEVVKELAGQSALRSTEFLVSLPHLTDEIRVQLAAAVEAGVLTVVADDGQIVRKRTSSFDSDRWRYEALRFHGSDLLKLRLATIRYRGLFTYGNRCRRYLYDASLGSLHIGRLLATWLRPFVAEHPEGDLLVCWVESEKEWMAPSIQALEQEIVPYSARFVEARPSGKGEPHWSINIPADTGEAVVVLPFIESGASGLSLHRYVTSQQVRVRSVQGVLTSASEDLAIHATRGVVALDGVSESEFPAKYILRVPQEYRGDSPGHRAKAKAYDDAKDGVGRGQSHPFDFWDFVTQAGCIEERVKEIPKERSSLVVPAFAHGMLEEGNWLLTELIQLISTVLAAEPLSGCAVVLPDGDLASTMLADGLRTYTDATVLAVPHEAIDLVPVDADEIDSDAIIKKVRAMEGSWVTDLWKPRPRRVLLLDEFRSSGRTLGRLNRLCSVMFSSGESGLADAALVLLDLRPGHPIAGGARVWSLASWWSQQDVHGKGSEMEAPAASLDADGPVARMLKDKIRNSDVGLLTRTLALDALASSVGVEAVQEFVTEFLPDKVREVLGLNPGSAGEGDLAASVDVSPERRDEEVENVGGGKSRAARYTRGG